MVVNSQCNALNGSYAWYILQWMKRSCRPVFCYFHNKQSHDFNGNKYKPKQYQWTLEKLTKTDDKIPSIPNSKSHTLSSNKQMINYINSSLILYINKSNLNSIC